MTGLHITSVLPSGKLFLSAGPSDGGHEEIRVEVRGQSGHAARPDLGVDALVLAAQGIVAAQQAVSRGLSPRGGGPHSGRIEGGTRRKRVGRPDHARGDHAVLHPGRARAALPTSGGIGFECSSPSAPQ